MFKDIRGRELHLGDLILYNFNALLPAYAYGILLSENKIALISGGVQEVRKEVYCCLIDDPNEDELSHKKKIINNYKYLTEESIKQSVNKLSLGTNYSRGDILSDSKADYLYLGSVEIKDLTYDTYNFSGHAYISVWGDDLDNTLISDTLYKFNNCHVCIDCSDGLFGNDTGSYTLKLQKKKSSRFNSVLSHFDISSLDNQELTYIRNTNGYYEQIELQLIFK